IFESAWIQKGIRLLVAVGDSMYIGSDFGLSVFTMAKWEFGETYANFGFTGQTRVNSLLLQESTIWVATDRGVARAPRTAPNLSSPTFWERFTSVQGLPSNSVTAIAEFKDTVIVGTAAGFAWFDGTGFQANSSTSGRTVRSILVEGNTARLLLTSGSTHTLADLSGCSAELENEKLNPNGTASSMILGPGGIPWIGTLFGGVTRWGGTSWEYALPNGPASNFFIGLVVDDNGRLWCGSGVNLGGRGIYRFDPAAEAVSGWKNFTVAGYPMLGTNDFYKVARGTVGRVWASSWGGGVAEFAGDSLIRVINATTTPKLPGAVAHDLNFVVAGGVAVDPAGDTWIVARSEMDGTALARLTNYTTIVLYQNRVSPSDGRFSNLTIDRNGTKWMANS
ncbi:MAG: hypothetical protein WD295_01690, partial [Bacteroidota bacterium]